MDERCTSTKTMTKHCRRNSRLWEGALLGATAQTQSSTPSTSNSRVAVYSSARFDDPSSRQWLLVARPLPASMSLHVLLEIRHVLLVVASGTFSLASQVHLAAAASSVCVVTRLRMGFLLHVFPKHGWRSRVHPVWNNMMLVTNNSTSPNGKSNDSNLPSNYQPVIACSIQPA